MAWIWAGLPTAVVVLVTMASEHPVAAIPAYHLLCGIVVVARRRSIRHHFTWS